MSAGAGTGSHGHAHGPDRRSSRRVLSIALVLTTVTMTVEAVAGWWSGSLALLADAVLTMLSELCLSRFDIDHTTFQLEWGDRQDREPHTH